MSKESLMVNKSLQNFYRFKKYLTPAILLGIILIIGAGLRFYDLGTESYLSDEMYTVLEAKQSVYQLVTSGRLDQPPAYYLPLLLWVKIFGSSEASTRSLSALVGIGSIFLIYFIGKKLFSNKIGVLSAFIMAISGIQIYYSQTARFYSFFEFTSLLSFYFFILCIQSNKVVHYFLYGVTSILMVYSHAFGIFIIAAQNLVLILQIKYYRKLLTHWIFCQVLILIAIVPYFYPLAFGGDLVGTALSNTAITPPPPIIELLVTFSKLIIPFRFDQSWGAMILYYCATLAFLVIGTYIYAINLGKRQWKIEAREMFGNLKVSQNCNNKFLLVICWLFCPILLPFIISWVAFPIYQYRYMIDAAGALYLLIALGMWNIRKVVPLFVSVGALLVLIVPGLHYYYVADVKDQWQEVARYVEEKSKPNDVIVFPNDEDTGNHKGIKYESFYWYYKGTIISCNLNLNPKEVDVIIKSLMQCASDHDRFWLISHTFDPAINSRIKSIFLNPNQTTLHIITEKQFVGLVVYLFELTN